MRLVKDLIALFRQAGAQWSEDKVPQLGAALAYYSLFSIAPLFLVAIAIAGLVFGEDAARGEIVARLRDFVGPAAAESVEQLILRARPGQTGMWAMIGSGISVLVGASWVFAQLQDSLNTIWKVRPRAGRGLWSILRGQLFSFMMVMATGVLLVMSLLLTAGLSALGQLVPGELFAEKLVRWRIVNDAASFAIEALLFALIFRQLPEMKIAWNDVWIGAAFTALLFTAGKYLIGLYLGSSGMTSAYGAAGSPVLLLLWVYYSALIVLFGAEFTRAWADRFGSLVQPQAAK